MRQSKFKRKLRKTASGQLVSLVGNGAYLLGALAVAATAAQGVGAGYLTGAAGSPGAQDVQNLQLEHRLARLNRDNQTQRLLRDRQASRSNKKNIKSKSMRVF